MTKREKTSTAKRASSRKSKEEVPPPDAGPPVEYRIASVPSADGHTYEMLAPRLAGRPEDVLDEDALTFAKLLLRLDEWKPFLTPKVLENRLEVLAELAATKITQRLLMTAIDRFGMEAVGHALGTSGSVGEIVEQVAAKQQEFLRKELQEQDPNRLVGNIERAALASLTLEVRTSDSNRRTFANRWRDAFEKQYFEHVAGAVGIMADHLAHLHLEALNADAATLDQIVEFLTPTAETRLHVGTSGLSAAISGSILRAGLDPVDELVPYEDGRRRDLLKVRTSVSVDALLEDRPEFEQPTIVLQNIQKALVDWKTQGAALLKVHLDLVNMAYQHTGPGGDEFPVFEYRLSDALERQGYRRQKRGFHPDTMRGLRERLEALYHHRVMAWKMKRKETGEVVFSRTPFWIIEEEFFVRQGTLDLDIVPSIFRLDDRQAATYTAVRIRPGAWWHYARMNSQFLTIPASVLQLPTDGRGNEPERWALRIANFLAYHVRVNQSHSAGKAVSVRVGTLLEKAGITSKEEFLSEKAANEAKRVREYLENDQDERRGALGILRELGAFHVTVGDEEGFFAVGRGWKERFWNARLELLVPDAGIAPRKPPKRIRR